MSFTPRPIYHQRKNPWFPFNRRLGGPQSLSGRFLKYLTVFYVLLTVHLSIFILVINQLDAQIFFCFTISLFHASTCFEHHVLIVRRSKLYYTASGIITSLNLCTGRPPIDVMIPEAVQYNFDLLTMSTWCSKHVEA